MPPQHRLDRSSRPSKLPSNFHQLHIFPLKKKNVSRYPSPSPSPSPPNRSPTNQGSIDQSGFSRPANLCLKIKWISMTDDETRWYNTIGEGEEA
jgi:hypothetical protein